MAKAATAVEKKDAIDVPKVGLIGSVIVIVWSALIFGHIAKWAVDSWYYAITQTNSHVKDFYDRFVVHLDNGTGHRIALLHHYINNGQAAPGWWYTDRHALRNLAIGTFAGLIVGALVSKPGKTRKHYGGFRMAMTPILVLATAFPIWVLFGLLFSRLPQLYNQGWWYSGNNPYLEDVFQLLGKHSFQLTVVGVAASFVIGKLKIASGPMDELQWHMAELGFKFPLLPNFNARVKYLKRHPELKLSTADAGETDKERHARKRAAWALSLMTLFILISAGAGFWIVTYGPGASAHI